MLEFQHIEHGLLFKIQERFGNFQCYKCQELQVATTPLALRSLLISLMCYFDRKL